MTKLSVVCLCLGSCFLAYVYAKALGAGIFTILTDSVGKLAKQ